MNAAPNPNPYAHPDRPCDIVMKGGITSGVVYPLAACELARKYFFKNIGGNSAGAIAASVLAAAEYRRRHGSPDGFAELEDLPKWLGEGGNLFHLFQPARETEPVFAVLCAALEGQSKPARIARALAAVYRRFWDWALLGAAPGLVLGLMCLAWAPGLLLLYGLACALGLAALLGTLAAVAALAWTAVTTIPRNGFGLCRGSAAPGSEPPPLTDWLSDYLDRVAAKNPADGPLTFGDLWNAPGKLADDEAHSINLEVMTTNLTHGRPHRLPFDTDTFFYDPEEFAQLFPQRIVDWMKAHPRPSENEEQQRRWARQLPLLPWPDAADLPVVVAVRMSLSFPVLLSAVPLHATDWSRTENQEARAREAQGGTSPLLEKCWFSDGGICSNFPVHLFDQLLPRWPTFALNLRPFHPDHPRDPDEAACTNVWLPPNNRSGILEWWNRFDSGPVHQRLFAFLGAILTTMQNWVDNTQTKMPGYRDRVAHICHTDQEGGLNLNMPVETIASLTERGRCAGRKLRERFAEAPPEDNGWASHRWIRYRSTMALLEETLAAYLKAYESPVAGDTPYAQLIPRDDEEPPKDYPLRTRKRREFAQRTNEALVKLLQEWRAEEEKFAVGAPHPRPELRVRPRV